MNNKRSNVLQLTCAAICLALCMILPFLTGQIPEIGSMLSPMHIPVLLCGFICGPAYAAAVGVIAPVLRFMIFGMPPLFPVGAAMCFELLTYGLVSSLLYRALPRRKTSIYVALVCAMLAGRVVWGVASMILRGIAGTGFTWAAFMAGAFTSAIPGIILHIALIPVIVMALERAVPEIKRA
ncbi:MAG: ECF transporter S component [Clostridia bacterium]|nr:ECF transporter S component [Clostridia bacterium]